MKPNLVLLVALSAVLCGCSNSTAATLPSSTEASETPGGSTSIACDDVAFALDSALASGYTCEIVPEFDNDTVGNPEYVRITLEGYPLSSASWSPEISIYPVAEFSAMVDAVPGIVANLEASISDGDPVVDEWGALPFLLNQDQGQFFYAQYEVVPFESGTGIRYLTDFTQDMGVFQNPEVYTYQAMTEDGRYWVSSVFPISHPLLPNEATWPPDGMTEEEFSAMYDTYVADNVDQLNSQSLNSFNPTIDALDALVASITIEP